MSFRRLYLILIVLTVTMELVLGFWQYRSLTPSVAPVFTWPQAAAHFAKTAGLEETIEQYQCDRASRYKDSASGGIDLESVYLEWDRLEAGPAMGFSAHGTEICSVAAGYKLLGIDANRVHQIPGADPIRFDCTRFLNPAGRTVYMFKSAWVQGLGSWQLRDEGDKRFERLKRSFQRHTGEARVVLTGVFGAGSQDEAWQVFNDHVLNQFVWSHIPKS